METKDPEGDKHMVSDLVVLEAFLIQKLNKDIHTSHIKEFRGEFIDLHNVHEDEGEGMSAERSL